MGEGLKALSLFTQTSRVPSKIIYQKRQYISGKSFKWSTIVIYDSRVATGTLGGIIIYAQRELIILATDHGCR